VPTLRALPAGNARLRSGRVKVPGEELDGGVTPEPQILSPVDDAHAAAAKSLDNAVVRDRLAESIAPLYGLCAHGFRVDFGGTERPLRGTSSSLFCGFFRMFAKFFA
jgi:hypothetical protein